MAAKALVAVATNFKPAALELVSAFHARTSHEIHLVAGSTGMLYAQLAQGAPYDVYFAADRARPARLVGEGLAVAATLQTYAVGQLVLFAADPEADAPVDEATLLAGNFSRLALANPKLAPYGTAALQTLRSLGIEDEMTDKFVYGENVGQAYALVATGNAELGFVARSTLREPDIDNAWPVPAAHHEPVRQDVVLLNKARDSQAARAFLAFALGEDGAEIIRAFGYRPAPR